MLSGHTSFGRNYDGNEVDLGDGYGDDDGADGDDDGGASPYAKEEWW
jgi:hypothetical protein